MPYSFTKIEEDKSKTIGLVFFFLIVFYFLTIWLISLVVYNMWCFYYVDGDSYDPQPFMFRWLSGPATLLILSFSLAAAIGHWLYTIDDLCFKILRVVRAEKLNLNDSYHKMFRNILDEVSVATGGGAIEGVVISSAAMNAFAVADFSGRNVIGVTEGLLARLSRAQIEAVVGHEAAHIVSGDCLQTTVISSVFELYSGILSGFEKIFNGSEGRYSGRGSGSSGGVIILLFVYFALSTTKFMGQLIHMFISREREIRADAVAVRLTRDPLSLAQALYSISRHWRGAGLASEKMEAIFTINPNYSAVDEQEDFWSGLFSTHPPVSKRINVLLDIASMDAQAMIDDMKSRGAKPRTEVPLVNASDDKWMVNREGQWEGPFGLNEIIGADWLQPQLWVEKIGGGQVMMAQEEKDIKMAFAKDKKLTGYFHCPKCNLPLSRVIYEGLEIHKCAFCEGVFVHEGDVQKVIIRQEVGFSDRIKRLGDQITKDAQTWSSAKINRDPQTLLMCPQCQHERSRMNRTFYTAAYHVEIDICILCAMIWFDKDEFEVLQYLIETVTAPKESE